MDLDTTAISDLNSLIKAAMAAQLQCVLIDEINDVPTIRGIDETQTVFILSTDSVPVIGGKKLGINRLGMFAQRLSVISAAGPIAVSATEAKNGKDISKLEISAGKNKVDYRCVSVDQVNGVPKTFADVPAYQVTFPTSQITTILQASASMASDSVVISAKEASVLKLEFVDQSTNDTFKLQIDAQITNLDGSQDAPIFANSYHLKSILPFLKDAQKTGGDLSLMICEGGTISAKLFGFPFFILAIA